MAWEHAADYEPGTFGHEMYRLEQAAKALGPAGAGELAKVDQLTARFRHYQEAAIFGTEPPDAVSHHAGCALLTSHGERHDSPDLGQRCDCRCHETRT